MKENVFSYLDLCLSENKIPHAFLIETNNINDFETELIDFLYEKKLIKNKTAINNLNLIIIEPDGKEIKSGEIDMLRSRFSTIPANDQYNIYLIKEADKMNISSANKLLKFLEEPTDFILAFLISWEHGQVLPTIKSRCQTFKYLYENQNQNIIDNVNLLVNYIIQPSSDIKLEVRTSLSNLERIEVMEIIGKTMSELENKLETRGIATNIILLDNILHLLKSNVNIELVLDKLFIEVR